MLLLILFFITHSFAKLYPDNLRIIRPSNIQNRNSFANGATDYIIGDPLWVLILNNDDLIAPKLRLGTLTEQEDFYSVVGPTIKDLYTRRSTPRVKKDNPEKIIQPTEKQINQTNIQLRREIKKFVNKFALSTSDEPDSYLTENIDENIPTIALYFKGPVTCIVVKLGLKQWHYVITRSPFPAWFYERHDTFYAPLPIPDEVQTQFYTTVLRFLKVTLYHPL